MVTARMKRAVRVLVERRDRRHEQLVERQAVSATETQAGLEAVATGMRLLRGSLAELADEVRGAPAGSPHGDDLALLRAAALGAVAASGKTGPALALGAEVGGDLAALGIDAADPAGHEAVDLVVVVALELPDVPIERLAMGGTLVLAVGRGVSPARLAALAEPLSIDGSVAIVPAGAAGFDVEPNDPSRADVARLLVARRC